MILWTVVTKTLSIPLVKFGLAVAVVAPVAAAVNAPLHDPFFDILGLIFLNAIVTGAPEPDMWKTMPPGEFLYLWYYRSSHGFLGSATAYFAHRNMWGQIAGGKPATTQDEEATK